MESVEHAYRTQLEAYVEAKNLLGDSVIEQERRTLALEVEAAKLKKAHAAYLAAILGAK